MRSFRHDGENLRDTRIAYTFLLSLALVCAILGIISTRLGGDLQKSRLEKYYESLTLCADSLESWRIAQTTQDRYEASVRFESAAANLPSEVELEPILSLADYMRMGEGAAQRVRTFEETFALLAAIDYASEPEARRIIAQALDEVNAAVNGAAMAPAVSVIKRPAEVLEYSKKVAESSVRTLLGANSTGLELAMSEDGAAWGAQTENLRMSFSTEDGSLDAFVYIRIGDKPSDTLSGEELISKALDFYRSTRRHAGIAQIGEVAKMCGFTLCEITDGEELWHSVIDDYGRIWSLTKVKR